MNFKVEKSKLKGGIYNFKVRTINFDVGKSNLERLKMEIPKLKVKIPTLKLKKIKIEGSIFKL